MVKRQICWSSFWKNVESCHFGCGTTVNSASGKLRFLSSVVFALTGGCYIDILISSKFNCLQGMIRLAGNTTTYCHRGISWIPKKMQARIDYKSLCWSGLCQKASTITIIFSCSPSKMEFASIPVYPVVLSLAMVCWILLKFPCVLTEKTRWIHRFLLIYLHFFRSYTINGNFRILKWRYCTII